MSVPATAHQTGTQTHQDCPLNPRGSMEEDAGKPKSKDADKARQKSVFDADVLESPWSFFRDANSDSDKSDAAPQSTALIIAVKALIATLLSTIL